MNQDFMFDCEKHRYPIIVQDAGYQIFSAFTVIMRPKLLQASKQK